MYMHIKHKHVELHWVRFGPDPMHLVLPAELLLLGMNRAQPSHSRRVVAGARGATMVGHTAGIYSLSPCVRREISVPVRELRSSLLLTAL